MRPEKAPVPEIRMSVFGFSSGEAMVVFLPFID
jgi:hypothetical protein